MKKMIKSALALVAAVVLGSSAWAADLDESCDVTMTVGVTSNMLAKLNVADADKANWVLHSSDKTIATVEWAKDGDKNVVAITSVANGQAEVVARSPEDVEYTFNVYVSTVEMEKSIKAASETNPNDKSNATIRVVTHVDCGKTDRTPRVLFIGSLCGKHSLKQETVEGAMKAIVKKATVDWFFFDNGKSDYNNVTCKNGYHGTFEQSDDGSTVKNLPSVGNTSDTKHCNLKAYLSTITNCLDIASDGWQQYDFVVLEFDSDRLLEYYDHDEALEKRAARCLKKFYEKHLVLWLLDNEPSDNPWGKGDESTPWWTPTTYTKNGAAAVGGKWNGYVALFDPETYFDKANGERYVSFETKSGTTYYKANRINEQVMYNNSEDVIDAINKYMKFPSFAAEAADKVVTAGGTMSIPTETGSVTLWNWTGKDDPVADDYMADDTGWEKETDTKKQPKVDGDQVTCVVSNLNGSTWQKLEIKVRTTPEFMAAAIADAKGDQKFCKSNGDGTFDVNPNNGDATMELSRSLDGKKQGTLATGAAAAANAWIVELPEFAFTVSAVNRSYNGASTNVTVSVTDKDSGKPLVASYYKLAYSTDGGTTWTTNTVDNFYAAFKDVVDTTVAVKVVIIGDDTYKPSDESKSATLKITPLTVTVKAGNGSKTYDSKAADLSATTWSFSGKFADGEQDDIEALISAGITNKQGKTTAFVLKDGSVNAGTYDITTNKVLTANKNYNVNFTPGTFVITPAQINVYDNQPATGSLPSMTKPYAYARDVVVITNDVAGGFKGANITVVMDLFGNDEQSVTPNYESDVTDLVYQQKVSCTLSGNSNYILPTNVWAYVTVKERVTEIDKANAGSWNPGKTSTTDAALAAVAKATVAKKGWKDHQITADAKLVVTAVANLQPAEQDVVKKETETVEKKFKSDFSNYDLFNSECVDVKVQYIEEFDDATPRTVENLSSVGDTRIAFTVNFADTDNLVAVYHCHGTACTKLKKVSSLGSSKNVYKVGKGAVTIQLSEFSRIFFETGAKKVVPPPKGCQPQATPVEETAWIYEWKFTGKTTDGVKIAGYEIAGAGNCKPGRTITVADEAIRVPSTLKIQGYTAKCVPACEDISTADFAGDGEVFWLTKPFKGAFDVTSGLSGLEGHVIAKSGNKYELAGRFSGADGDAGEFYDFVFAGIGSYSKSKLRVSSVSGNFAGFMAAPHYHKYDTNLAGCPEAQIWNCDQSAYAGAPETVAFGKWSMKYLSTASKKYLKDGTRPKAKNGAKWHN